MGKQGEGRYTYLLYPVLILCRKKESDAAVNMSVATPRIKAVVASVCGSLLTKLGSDNELERIP